MDRMSRIQSREGGKECVRGKTRRDKRKEKQKKVATVILEEYKTKDEMEESGKLLEYGMRVKEKYRM